MKTIPARSILQRGPGDSWFGAAYNMNIYRGCCHGCIYCDSRSDCYQIDQFDEVRAKENALTILERELQTKRKKGMVSTGAMSDPYNPYEAEAKLTQGALELLEAYGYGICIATKSVLAARDSDILARMANHAPAVVKFTITTADDVLCKKIEPHVSVTSERLAAMRRLVNAGVRCGILLMPVLPFLTDTEENIQTILTLAKENGASFAMPSFGVTLRQNQRTYFYNRLHEQFPGIAQQYQSTYGTQYSCTSPNARRLRAVFSQECKKLGLVTHMKDIVSLIHAPYECKQLSLF